MSFPWPGVKQAPQLLHLRLAASARIRAATNLTGPGHEPLSGGERNAAFTAGRVAEAAASVGAHIVVGAGNQHILDAVAWHLPGPFGPITTIASGPVPENGDERPGAQSTTALLGSSPTQFGAGDQGTESRCRWRMGWSGPRCAKTRSSCSYRTAPVFWPGRLGFRPGVITGSMARPWVRSWMA